ncbi:PD-(D/E)XK nuclease family protein [Ornithinimicrobium sp. INDO-MA30-4]|nr:PD-(D/E)XK nuclease family protein [Ornithinimicrobium sp. INDO-MA30-4]UJH71541.1 PD-(D/E)XK nuclease family protein [Ornithinimicrobium sp. INDO-MA30-4]
MLRRYVGYRDSNARQLVAVEISGRADVGRARLSGQVDRIERDADGGFVVIDLKTGASAPSKVDLLRHPQLGAYQVALEHGAFRDETGAEPMSAGSALVQIGGTRIKALSQPQVALSMDDEPDWAENLVRDTADGMAGDRFLAKVGSHCNTCPVRLACPAQPEGDRE